MFKPLRWIVLIYGTLCALFYGYQQHFYFQPKKVSKHATYDFPGDLKYASVKLPFDSATVIDVIRFYPEDSVRKGVVLFFHGNRHNVMHYSSYAPYFVSKGYECWMPDYPGYGRSSGEMNVELLQQIAEQLYKMARAKYDKEEIVLYGKSLGTGIAAYLASVRDCKSVLLETPYRSLEALTGEYLFFMPVQWLVKYDLNTHAYFKEIAAPVTVLHGSKDELIPLSNAAMLLNDMKTTDAFYVIPGGRHNTLPEYSLYHSVIDSVLLK